jgi:lysophospholipase L1-like esterase
MNRRSFLQAAGTAAICSAGTLWLSTRSRFAHSSYIQMGTSVTSGVIRQASITPAIVGNRLGMSGINAGMPGACVGNNKYPEIGYRDLHCLVDSMVSDEWTKQRAADTTELRENLSRLMTADFSKPTYLGLEYGTNDFGFCRKIGVNSDMSCETFKGALNYSLDKISKTFPQARVFLITPAWLLNFQNLDSDTNPNEIGIYLKDYVDAMVDLAALHHIPCLDMWRNLGINKSNYKTFTFDGTHPTSLGAARRGDVTASFINSVF